MLDTADKYTHQETDLINLPALSVCTATQAQGLVQAGFAKALGRGGHEAIHTCFLKACGDVRGFWTAA